MILDCGHSLRYNNDIIHTQGVTMQTTQPNRYTIMRSSFIKSRIETVENTLYVLINAAKNDAEPVELSHALRLVVGGLDEIKELLDDMIDDLHRTPH